METLGFSGMGRHASHPGMKDDNTNIGGWGLLVASSLWVPALRAGVPLLRAGCWLQCGLDVLDNKGMPFHKIDEQIGDTFKLNLVISKFVK